jgi:hypothetical protein
VMPLLLCRASAVRRLPPLPSSSSTGTITHFEACAAFNRYGLQARAVTKVTISIVGFDALVTSFVATIATGWSDPYRVGLSPH